MIIGSIKTKLLTLDGDIRVISGHGPETSIAFEKKHNMFLRWGQAMWVCLKWRRPPSYGDFDPNLWWFWLGNDEKIIGTGGWPIFRQAHFESHASDSVGLTPLFRLSQQGFRTFWKLWKNWKRRTAEIQVVEGFLSTESGRFGRFWKNWKRRTGQLVRFFLVKVLLVTLELAQHWLGTCPKKNRRLGALKTDVSCQEKIGAEGGDGVGAKFWAPRKHRLELNIFLGTLNLHKLGWLMKNRICI